MSNASSERLPARIEVSRVVASRYGDEAGRPRSWDERFGGVDLVESADGAQYKLLSDGQQSTPHPGWVILLISGSAGDGYRWTLYGMPKAGEAASA
jgi:hypothetical protein